MGRAVCLRLRLRRAHPTTGCSVLPRRRRPLRTPQDMRLPELQPERVAVAVLPMPRH